MARPTKQFDEKHSRLVAALARHGVKPPAIARDLGIDPRPWRNVSAGPSRGRPPAENWITL